MRLTIFLFVLLTRFCFAQDFIVKQVSVEEVGWKRVALLNGAYGRGYNELTMATIGGSNSPYVTKISWFKGWSNYGNLNIESVSNSGYWSEARITFDGTFGYLEVNFTAPVDLLRVSIDQRTWSGGDVLNGPLPNGGGNVITSAKFGRLNYGENDLYLSYSGKVGIGTTTPDAALTVNGMIHTSEVKVDLNGLVAPDYVFSENYNIKSLEEVEHYIKENRHLPNIPSAKEMQEEGVNLKAMNLKLLEKIEELTLHVIALKKTIDKQEERIKDLEK
ncbi:hypothetical protein HX109_10950 [Galbibacter sp. BG1]|uniref:tail fiber protein n=1 Tax=Galbibacter sp. BG1 TaxID=1170699 RepID=UPI0015B9A5B0|nr:tail fiber protein [Galbibacter sp. BG1]QLE02046.1 hypothetical protein HX109_10950 [Galbibacter sp. BG1]